MTSISWTQSKLFPRKAFGPWTARTALLQGLLLLGAIPCLALPEFTAEAITNAAGNQNAGVAPGEILVIYGTGLGPADLMTLQVAGDRVTTSLAGVRVLFDGVPAPLIYVWEKQVSAIVPYSVFPGGTTDVTIEYQGETSAVVTVPTLAAEPGIFTANSSGSGQGAILNQDLSVNSESNPADLGDVVVLYTTGEGFTSPSGQDGLIALGAEIPKPLAPIRVEIGGKEAPIHYAGGAPLLVAGVMQVNAQVPSAPPDNILTPIYLYVRNQGSQNGVQVSVFSEPEVLEPGGAETLYGLGDSTRWRAGVVSDQLLPFEVRDGTGAIVLSGKLQDRVGINFGTSTGQFSPIVRDMDDLGSGARVVAIEKSGFAGKGIQIEYSYDLNRVAPKTASRSQDGDTIIFAFDPGVPTGQQSTFPEIFTNSNDWEFGGQTTIRVKLPDGTLLSTVVANTTKPK